MQKRLKLFLLLGLRLVISGPLLPVGFLNGNSLRQGLNLPVVGVLALDRVFNGEDMLAAKLASLKVWTGAMWFLRIWIDGV
jgi:hypothetical protein